MTRHPPPSGTRGTAGVPRATVCAGRNKATPRASRIWRCSDKRQGSQSRRCRIFSGARRETNAAKSWSLRICCGFDEIGGPESRSSCRIRRSDRRHRCTSSTSGMPVHPHRCPCTCLACPISPASRGCHLGGPAACLSDLSCGDLSCGQSNKQQSPQETPGALSQSSKHSAQYPRVAVTACVATALLGWIPSGTGCGRTS